MTRQAPGAPSPPPRGRKREGDCSQEELFQKHDPTIYILGRVEHYRSCSKLVKRWVTSKSLWDRFCSPSKLSKKNLIFLETDGIMLLVQKIGFHDVNIDAYKTYLKPSEVTSPVDCIFVSEELKVLSIVWKRIRAYKLSINL